MGGVGKQENSTDGNTYLGEIVDKIKHSEAIKELRNTEPPLLAVLMFLISIIIFLVFFLLYILITKIRIILYIFIALGIIGWGFYFLAKKISTHNNDKKYY